MMPLLKILGEHQTKSYRAARQGSRGLTVNRSGQPVNFLAICIIELILRPIPWFLGGETLSWRTKP
jgi:hypothetical protein